MANRNPTPKPDPHFFHYLQKRDAMVARAVTNRLKQRLRNATEKGTRMFYSISTPSRTQHPPITASIEPGKSTSTAIFISYVSSSKLVREPPPQIKAYLKPIRQVKAKRVFKVKVESPPASRTRSKIRNKKKPQHPNNSQPNPHRHLLIINLSRGLWNLPKAKIKNCATFTFATNNITAQRPHLGLLCASLVTNHVYLEHGSVEAAVSHCALIMKHM